MRLKKQWTARAMSVLLACTMTVSGLPAMAQAAEAESASEVVAETGAEGASEDASEAGTQKQHGYQTVVKEYAPVADGTVYYVDSEAGSDENDGTSPGKAFQTLDKVNGVELKPGDSILLKKEVFSITRGCIQREKERKIDRF